MRKKILTAIGLFFILLIFTLIGAYYLTQTEYFRNLVRDTAENIVKSTTGQELRIGNLEGDFFNIIKLTDVELRVENESFVTVNELTLDYSLRRMMDGSLLFSKVVPLDDVKITGINVNLIKYEDGTWNFSKFGDKNKDQDKEKSPPQWSIILPKFLLKNGTVTLDNREQEKFSQLDIPEIDLSVKLINITQEIELNVRNADMAATNPDIIIEDLSVKASYQQGQTAIENLKAIVNGSKFKVDASATGLDSTPKFELSAKALDYELENIGTLSIAINAQGEMIANNDIRATASIDIPESTVLERKIRGSLGDIRMRGTVIEIGDGDIESELGQLLINGSVNLERLLTKEGNNSLNMDITLKDIKTSEIFTLIEETTDKKPGQVNTELGAVLNSSINVSGGGAEFDDILIITDIKQFEIKGDEAGDLKITGTAEYTKPGVKLDINSNFEKVNLASILSNQNLYSDITSDLSVKGFIPLGGNFIEHLSADITGDIKPSKIFNLDFTSGKIDIAFENELLQINALTLNSDSLKLNVQGNSTKSAGMDIKYDIDTESLGFVSPLIKNKEIAGSLKATGTLKGSIKSPTITANAEAKNFSFDEQFAANTLSFEGEGTLSKDTPEIKAAISIKEATLKDRQIESITLNAESKAESLVIHTEINENKDFSYILNASLQGAFSDEKNIEISRIKLNLEDSELENRDDIKIGVAGNKLIVENFNLYHQESSILANADVSYNGSVNASAKLANLDLDDLTKALQFKTPVQGALSADLNFSGSLRAPVINFNLRTRGLQYQEFENDDINFDINYLNNNLNMKFLITDDTSTILEAKGNGNIDLNLKEIGQNLNDATINMSIHSSGVDLSPVASVTDEIEKLNGLLIIELNANGKLLSPNLTGDIKLQEISLVLKTLKNEFIISDAGIRMLGQKGTLDEINITSGDGSGTFEGNIDIPTLTYNVTGTMDKLLLKPKNISANVSGDIDVKGEGEKIAIDGKLVIQRGRIKIPDHQQKEVEDIQFVEEDENGEFVVEDTENKDYFNQNVGLDLEIKMRKNNWVKGRGANIDTH